jgi:hypothetical protein
VHEEIDRLPEKYRAAVVLCHLEGRTQTQAAELLKIPAATVNTRVARARELLRDGLTRRGLGLAAVLPGKAPLFEIETAAVRPGLAEATIKAAMQVAAAKTVTAGAAPATVAQLTEGALRTMTRTKTAMAAALVLTVGSVTAGIALEAMRERPAPANTSAAATSAAQPAPAQKGEAALQARARSANNLKAIALTMLNVAAQTDEPRFPAAAIRGKDGKPLLSWRVAILPYLEQKALHDRFHLDEPWNSPHNKTLLSQMPDVYAPVLRRDEPRVYTSYHVFI